MSNENSSEARANRKKAAAEQTPGQETRAARLERRAAADKAANAVPAPSKKEGRGPSAAKRSAGRDVRLEQDSRKSRDARRAKAGEAAERQANPPETKKEKAAREKREADAKAVEPQPEA